MKRLFPIFCLVLAAICLSPARPARAQSGLLIKTFDIKAGKLLLDPNRPRLYATLPLNSGLAVIDTDTDTVLTTIPIGSNPQGLAISADGTRLYIADGSSMSAAIGVIDLTTLTTLPSLPAPYPAAAVVVGLDNRLYVLGGALVVVNGRSAPPIAQIDAATGTLQATFGVDLGGFLAISPDRKTLYWGNQGILPSTLTSFDVSTATPGPQRNATFEGTGANGEGLAVSHNGKFLVYPNGTSSSLIGGYLTFLFSATDLTNVLGAFDTGPYPGIAVFSADDSLLYQVQSEGHSGFQNQFKIFSTSTFTELDAFADPDPTSNVGYPRTVTGLALAEPNRKLYIAETDGTFENQTGYLEVATAQPHPFFKGAVALSDGFYYLKFSDGVPFGFYNFNSLPYLYHSDLGFEYPIDATDGSGGIFFYDFKSDTFWYTSNSAFPYLYDFKLNAWLYYYPDPTNSNHYNTRGVRYFYNFATGKIITK